jgi:hypothetical protein
VNINKLLSACLCSGDCQVRPASSRSRQCAFHPVATQGNRLIRSPKQRDGTIGGRPRKPDYRQPVAHLGGRWLLLLIWMVCGTPFNISAFSAEANGCDSDLISTSFKNGYQNRGDRCEGFFVQNISRRTFRLVSFYQVLSEFTPSPDKSLTILWAPPAIEQPVRLRATGIGYRVYYRMDTLYCLERLSIVVPISLVSRCR